MMQVWTTISIICSYIPSTRNEGQTLLNKTIVKKLLYLFRPSFWRVIAAVTSKSGVWSWAINSLKYYLKDQNLSSCCDQRDNHSKQCFKVALRKYALGLSNG